MPKAPKEDEFEVERILAEKKVRNGMRYLVKWKGYTDAECTWEPFQSFNSPETITMWKKDREKGKGLNATELERIEKQMDSAQTSSPDPTPLKRSGNNPKKAVRVPVPRNLCLKLTGIQVADRAKTNTSQDTPKQVPGDHNPRTSAPLRNNNPRTRRKGVDPKPMVVLKPLKGPQGSAGRVQKSTTLPVTPFKSLAHRNNARKKAKMASDLAPPPPLGLISPADLPAIDETAHILPTAEPMPSRGPSESWMFFPNTQNSASPSKNSQSTPDQNPEQLRSRPAFITRPSTKPANEEANQSHDGQTMEKTVHDSFRTLREANSRNDDILVHFKAWKEVGEVKLVNIPWDPIGKHLASLKDEELSLKITVDSTHILTRFELNVICSEVRSTGLVEGFPNNQPAVDEFCQYLEEFDSAFLWSAPSRKHISLLLFSPQAPSWQDFQSHKPRRGQPISRLHIAVIDKQLNLPLRELEVESSSPERLADSEQVVSEKVSNVTFHAASSVTPIATSCRKNSIKASDPRLNSRNKSQVSPNHGSTAATGKDLEFHRYLKAFREDGITPAIGMQFHDLCTMNTSNEKINKDNVSFYISFAKTFPWNAAMLKRWLEAHTKSSRILDDTQSEHWGKLRKRAPNNAMVILFHASERIYHTLDGLGELMNLDNVQCHSLTFGKYVLDTLTPISALRLFPRGTVFLVTEYNIVHESQEALFIIRFFYEKKKPGWKLVLRPDIRRWLRRLLETESENKFQRGLYDMLILIEDLIDEGAGMVRPLPQDNDSPDLEEFDVESGSFVISPDSLPGYVDASKSEKAIDDRDTALIDYFCGFARMMAPRYRRFWMFRKNKTIANGGHVYVEDPRKFVRSHKGA